MEAVVCVTIKKEDETLVKNRIARIRGESKFSDFFEEFVRVNKLEQLGDRDDIHKVDVEIRETMEGTV